MPERASRPLVMGVLNVTPDSFFDGGRWPDEGAAVARGLEMVAEGADVVDVGGESSRPGAHPVPEAEELDRVVPVVAALAAHVRVSVDTVKPAVARAAVAAGATLVNDISARLGPVAAELGVGWVAMHMRGTPADMQTRADYADVVGDVEAFFSTLLSGEGPLPSETWFDPGIGFAKTAAHNLALLAALPRLAALGRPLLVGVSRKSFLGPVGAGATEEPLAVTDRLEASLAAAVWAMDHGAAMVRVHDVAATVQAVRILAEVPGEAAA